MTHGQMIGLSAGIALLLVMGTAAAVEPPHDEHGAGARSAAATAPQHAHSGARPAVRQAAEPHPGPKGYQRLAEPKGWSARPSTVDRGAYQHNFQAARSYKIGPYHHPAGWRTHDWAYGQTLPRAYWASQYILADYWLFALEVPPAGYEWVRVDTDAILVSITNGEILQVEYGVFA